MRLTVLVLLLGACGPQVPELTPAPGGCQHGELAGSDELPGIRQWEVLVAPDPACREGALAAVGRHVMERNGWRTSPDRFRWRELPGAFPLDHRVTLEAARAEAAPDVFGLIAANVYCSSEDAPEGEGSFGVALVGRLEEEGFDPDALPRAFPGDFSLDTWPVDVSVTLFIGVTYGRAYSISFFPGFWTPVELDDTGRALCLFEEELREGEAEIHDCAVVPGRSRIDGDPTRCLVTMQPNPPLGPGVYAETLGGEVPHPTSDRRLVLRYTEDAFPPAGATRHFRCITRSDCADAVTP
ncbi:MAG: hypothetical protein AAGH15_04335 [Myxococcota bacterium]